MRYNPFRPNNLVVPGMFIGRGNELLTASRCLHQAKNGNPVHFLIQGERGIGKSSLFMVIEDLARGGFAPPGQDHLNFIVVSVDLAEVVDQIDIVQAIGRELRAELTDRDFAQAKAKEFVNWLLNWEVLGVKFKKETANYDPRAATDELVSRISSLCEDLVLVDGILILIDEADRPGAEAGLGAFCKLFTERLTRKSCTNVVLGVAGLPVVLQHLKESHESSPRLFTIMLLEPLLEEERKDVIKRGLQEANKKNANDPVGIDDDALALLADLSEGYPHFIQQFAYSAFDTCRGPTITTDDVVEGAYGENGAISQLGAKFFSEMYHSKIASDDYRKVLHIMAEHQDEWVSRKDIIKASSLPQSTVTNALNALKARQIIHSDESRKNKGFYRLPTRSFAAWLKAMESVSEKTGKPLMEVSGHSQPDDGGH